MKTLKGYIFSRPFLTERVPQHVQNIVIKDFCTKNNLNFLLSATEYSMNNSSYILSELINDLDNMHGIVAYSIFQLPEENKKRKEFLRKILKKKKIIFFACENLKVTNNIEMKAIDTLWKIRKTMQKSKVNEIYKTIK